MNKRDLSALWLSTFRSFHPDAPCLPLTVRESSALWQKQRLWNTTYNVGPTFAQFFCYVLERWASLMVREFAWIKDAHSAPSIWLFLGKSHPRFVESFTKRRATHDRSLTWTEIRVAQLLSLGLSRADAVARAAKEEETQEESSRPSEELMRKLTSERISLEREKKKATLASLSRPAATRRKVRVEIPDKFPDWDSLED